MKALIGILFVFLLYGCASTTIREIGPDRRYHKVFQTYADIERLEFRSAHTSLVAVHMNHSEPTRAGAMVVEKTLIGSTSIISVATQPSSPWAAIATACGDVFRALFMKK